MLCPQLQWRFIPFRNVLFASIKLFLSVPWLLSWPTGLLPFEPSAASLHPQPYSLPSRSHTFLPNLLLRCLCTTSGRRHTSQHQPGEGHLSGSMLSTCIRAFDVPCSSALDVNSSGLSLTITSEPPSGAFGFRTLNVPVPRRSAPTSRARPPPTVMNSRRSSVRPLLLSLPK